MAITTSNAILRSRSLGLTKLRHEILYNEGTLRTRPTYLASRPYVNLTEHQEALKVKWSKMKVKFSLFEGQKIPTAERNIETARRATYVSAIWAVYVLC